MDPSLYGQRITPPTAQKSPRSFSPKLLIIIGLMVFALLAGIGLLFMNSASKDPTLRQKLSVRQATTLQIIDDGQKNITSDSLKKINSELSLVLRSDDAELQAALTASGIKKADKEIVASESGAETLTSLKNAKLNDQYDKTYKTVIIQKLTTLRGLILEVHQQSRSKALKQTLVGEDAHIKSYIDQFEEVNL